MNRKRVFLMFSIILLGAVASAAPTADSVEDDAEAGWSLTAGNLTYLDFPFSSNNYIYSRNGLTLTRDAIDDWGDPDTSDTDCFVDANSMDDKHDGDSSDFSVTISGLTPNTEYGIALSIRGGTQYPYDFSWGTESDGAAVNEVKGIIDQPSIVVLSGTNFTRDELYAVPFYRATSNGSGVVKVWIGQASPSIDIIPTWRTHMDGILIGTELYPNIAWGPDPANGAANVSIASDLSWNPPSDANELWTYNVYIDTDDNPGDQTPYNVSEPNILNSVFGPLSFGNYWWRVDSIDPAGPTTHTGDTWTFQAGVALPTLVNPSNGSGGHPLELLLRWDSDDESVNSGVITGHRVILKNITDGTEGVSYDKPASQEDYYLANPDMWDIVFYEKEYTWKVVELGAGGAVLVEGPEWSFSTLDLVCSGWAHWGDLTGDCEVTLDDLLVMVSGWLNCGWKLDGGSIPYTEKDPCLW